MQCIVESYSPGEHGQGRESVKLYEKFYIEVYPDKFNNLIIELYDPDVGSSIGRELVSTIVFHKDNWTGYRVDEK